MGWWITLVKSPARRKAEQDRRRRQALTKARTALRRERRSIVQRQARADALRREAVQHEKEGKPVLAKQAVRQFIHIDKECTARALALGNMDYTLEQVQMKDNYDDFVRGMQVVADIEELAQQSIDPEEVRVRLADIAERNQDLVTPWTELSDAGAPAMITDLKLNGEEEDAYRQVMSDAVADLEGEGRDDRLGEFAEMDRELERKMNAACGKE